MLVWHELGIPAELLHSLTYTWSNFKALITHIRCAEVVHVMNASKALLHCALRSIAYLAPLSSDQTNVCWDPVSSLYLHNVSHYQLVCWHFLLFCISYDESLLKDRSMTDMSMVLSLNTQPRGRFKLCLLLICKVLIYKVPLQSFWGVIRKRNACYSYLWNHFTEASHNVCAFCFLIVSEDTSEDDDHCKDYTKVELISERNNPVSWKYMLSSSSDGVNHIVL